MSRIIEVSNDSFVSIKELNDVFGQLSLSNEREILVDGNFSEVDIVFVAGLFLYYKKINKKLPPIRFNLDNALKRDEIHKDYFKQVKDLYGVGYNDIFNFFPNLQSSRTYKPNSYSSSFAPPIYITKNYIDCFFNNTPDDNIKRIRDEYINALKKLKDKGANENEKSYFSQSTNITQQLESSAPIYTFIFSVAYHKINPFVSTKTKGFDSGNEGIKKIWQFTQEYVRGLHELAKNIVEHSGNSENDGQGMITIRAYSKDETDKTKVLETHVFDYGENGIFKTLRKNTEDNYNAGHIEEYKNDLEILNDTFSLKDFIESTDKFLYQQFYRDMAHYGLMNFKHLIDRHNGKIIASSVRDNNENKREQYVFSKYGIIGDELTECDITKGTSYYFEMPFDPKLFAIAENPILPVHSDALAVSALSKLKDLELKEYDYIEQQEADKTYLINIRVTNSFKEKGNYNINNRIIETDVCNDIIGKLSSPHIGNNYVAIDFDNIILSKSNLLRILARISREKLSNFIVYNVDCNEFIGLVEDNRQWFEKVKDKWKTIDDKRIDTSYWLKDKSILLFSRCEKIQKINDKERKEYFYFADFLFGETEKTFNSINKIIANTFPNTTYIQISTAQNSTFEVEEKFSIPHQLQEKFFYDQYLLPFDIFLKNKDNNEEKELFLFNIRKIIQNNLFINGTYNNIEDYVDNYDGYHIPNSHFNIGNKVHSSDFYYAKRLFQNSFYTTRLAMHLTIEIKNKLKEDYPHNNGITLVGYEMYSELLLSLMQKFLIEFGFDTIHFIAQDEDGMLEFKPKNIFTYKDSITIVIMPIASTGSTARRIVNTIQDRIVKSENLEAAQKIKYFPYNYNVLWAKPTTLEDSSDSINVEKDIKIDPDSTKKIEQKSIIDLPAEWYKLEGCPLCFNDAQRKPLYETDKSSITPAIIFDLPKGKRQPNKDAKEPDSMNFNKVMFENSLDYKNTYRNGEFRLYSVDTEKFVCENKSKIKKWLEKAIKETIKPQPIDKIVIVAPCNESNSGFVNLVNELVFNSSATIIYHQPETDFSENFKILYESYLIGAKIFYVDDSVISGKHFFEIYDLIRSSLGEKRTPFTASIVLKDKTLPYVHDRIVLWSNIYFAFVNINVPPNISLLGNQPLMYENKRYKLLSENFALHDVLIKIFAEKAKRLDYKNENRATKNEKEESHELQFRVTHKIYRYSSLIFRYKSFIESHEKIRDSLLKVLCQYPFILYKPLRDAIFEWHNRLLENIDISYTDCKEFYKKFENFKFLFRRAILLNNYKIVEESFLEKILNVFDSINKTLIINVTSNKNQNEISDKEIKSMEEFSIFLVRNYIELIQKNGWVSVHLKEQLDKLQSKFPYDKASVYVKQFYRMLQIELVIVIDDFVKEIEKEEKNKGYYEWLDMYKYTLETKRTTKVPNDKFITDNSYIEEFFKNLEGNSNKYEIVKSLLGLSDDWYKNGSTYSKFKNYLWIKQLLYADCIDKESHLPQNLTYQDKIDAIIDKMKGFFPKDNNNKNVDAFFVVTDNQNRPYSLYQDNYVLNGFENILQTSQELKDEFEQLSAFLNGVQDKQGIAKITIAEYTKSTGDEWNDLYCKSSRIINIKYLPNAEWLLLIRISQFSNNEFKTMGVLGFYGNKTDFSEIKPENLLPKQFLMLLRRDMGKFIEKHHKNDEFSSLRQAEMVKRFAYLAGHGRQTMQRLSNRTINPKSNNVSAILKTMDKLQYLFATKNISSKEVGEENREDILQAAFVPKPINHNVFIIENKNFDEKNENDIKPTIKELIELIYESNCIENKVIFQIIDKNKEEKSDDNTKNFVPDTLITINKIDENLSFNFNIQIIYYILFELIINAKKNRWHCIDPSKRCKCCQNTLDITIKIADKDFIIEVTSTGTRFDDTNKSRIENKQPIKDKYENEGLYLVSSILTDFQKNSNRYFPITVDNTKKKIENHQHICNCNYEHSCRTEESTYKCNFVQKMYKNKVTVTIKSI